MPRNYPKTREILGVYLEQDGLCVYCVEPLVPATVTQDHVIPRGWGGPDTFANIVLSCEACNTAKGKIEHEILHLSIEELDIVSMAALFALRCSKMFKNGNHGNLVKRVKYARMAHHVVEYSDRYFEHLRRNVPTLYRRARKQFI